MPAASARPPGVKNSLDAPEQLPLIVRIGAISNPQEFTLVGQFARLGFSQRLPPKGGVPAPVTSRLTEDQ